MFVFGSSKSVCHLNTSQLTELLMCRTLTEEVDPLTQAAFEMPADALPPLQYVPPEQVLAASQRSWGGFEGYRLMPLDPVAAAAEEAALVEQVCITINICVEMFVLHALPEVLCSPMCIPLRVEQEKRCLLWGARRGGWGGGGHI